MIKISLIFGQVNNYEKTIYKEVGVTRDSIMAYNFLRLIENQKPINGRKKALLIQNQPHAINIDVTYKNRRIKSTSSYIKDIYGDNIKIVLFNWYDFGSAFYFMPPREIELTDDGKWDAAFELSNHKPVGFDLNNSPFSDTKYHDNYEKNIKYNDIADGLIYYKPFYEFVAAIGIPHVVDNGFSIVIIIEK